MSYVIREEGFLKIADETGGLSGHAEFFRTRGEAEAAAETRLKPVEPYLDHPLFYVIPVTRLATEQILQARNLGR